VRLRHATSLLAGVGLVYIPFAIFMYLPMLVWRQEGMEVKFSGRVSARWLLSWEEEGGLGDVVNVGSVAQ